MASEITLKYLHPSIKTYITTENYNYDTSVAREVLFVADVFEHGVDNQLQQVNTLSEFLFKYGEPNFDKYGQAGYNVEKWLTNGNSAVIMRLLPEDASYAHAVFNIQYKNATNGKTVVNAQGNETKINDVYLRPLVTYIGVNNTSEKLLDSELHEDRRDYPTTDGYTDNFIFIVYPEGRGEYYNDLGFRIRLNPSYDGVLTSRVYTFEIIKFTGSTYDIIDGPYYVSFDPDAIDPNSQKSMYFENVVNSYSPYLKVKVNTDNYIKIANIINNEVDPYIVDIISGQSRIMDNGEPETYFSSVTGKDEDVHIALRKYSSNGIALTSNGNYILNISNNDETTSDIVDIADNSRRVVYNNQKYITQYMRSFYNWLIQDRVNINLKKIIDENIENDISKIGGLLKEKAYNLIYANTTNSDSTHYDYDGSRFLSDKVGAQGRNDAWYLKAQEIIQPGLKNKDNKYVGTESTTGFERKLDENGNLTNDSFYTSTSQMINTITEDGYISETNEHLISYFNNFIKYFEFVANYDVYNNKGFVLSDEWLDASDYYSDVNGDAKIYSYILKNGVKSYKTLGYTNIDNKIIANDENCNELTLNNIINGDYKNIFEYIINNLYLNENNKIFHSNNVLFKNNINGIMHEDTFNSESSVYYPDLASKLFGHIHGSMHSSYYPVYIDSTTNSEVYIPIVDFTTYDVNGDYNKFGTYIKVYTLLGDEKLVPINGLSILAGTYDYTYDEAKFKETIISLFEKYVFKNPNYSIHSDTHQAYINTDFYIFDKNNRNSKVFKYNIKTNYTYASLGINNSIASLFNLLFSVYNTFKNNNFSDYIVLAREKDDNGLVPSENMTYNDFLKNKNSYSNIKEFSLTNYINFFTELLKLVHGINTKEKGAHGGLFLPGTDNRTYIFCAPITMFNIPMKTGTKNNPEGDTTDIYEEFPISIVMNSFYFYKDDISSNTHKVFDPIFSDSLKNGKLTQSFNKVSSYAALISKELDGKGKDVIDIDINDAKTWTELDYSDYSLTTIFNLLIGGFESIVNNQGSITDYSNYASLKYLMKTINNNLDLRSTYLTLLNVHRNTILDLSTKLAKNNASLILGDETLDTLYSAMDTIVEETNYLITNIINTILSKEYTIKNLESLEKVSDGKPYAYYFTNLTEDEIKKMPGKTDEEKELKKYYSSLLYTQSVDPLGITVNIDSYGKKEQDPKNFKGILPLLEKILINITGENHYGDSRDTIYGGQPLVEIYDDIKNGYTVNGLTQDVYEKIYQVLTESLGYLSDVHQIINAFVNEKYISDIINTLVGTININNVNIKYNGATYSVNGLFEYYNSGVDENLTQTMVTNLINDAIGESNNVYNCPILPTTSDPIIQYPYYCIDDILNSVSIAKANKDIVKSNIHKQDQVLASLNTLCYDNLVTNVNGPLGFAEGSDGSFEYDNSTSAALRKRMNKINDIRIKAYKGTWNEDVLNKDLFEFDHIFDACYEDSVKNAIITLARDERQDFFFWADTKVQNTVQDCIDWKTSFTNSTYFMSIMAQSQTWYDEYTSKNINLTSTYLIADLLPKHIDGYGRHYPMAGSRRGVVGGFISNDWYPNEEQKEKLYTNKVNYLEKDISIIRIGAQNTNYPTGPLGQINNMLVLLKIKRNVEKIAKTYQFEFNTEETRSAMASEINKYLTNWTNNGACTVATAEVYASDYDIIQKIVRVDVTLQFTGVIERIVINIDCPASI